MSVPTAPGAPGAPTLLEHLAGHVERLTSAPLAPAVAEKVSICLVDHLAALLSAHNGPVERAGRGILPLFGSGAATLVGLRTTSSPAGAVFYNALAATSEDLDDAHRYASGLHMSATTFPVLFALAEEAPVSGELFARAVVAGYEVSSRLVRAADAGLRGQGFHSTGAAGVFGACAAAGVMLGLDRATLVSALGMAASGAGGLFAFLREGSSVRHAHGAWACLNGLTAARLAQEGLTGPVRALEGYGPNHQDGYLKPYAGTWDERFITDDAEPEILNTYHKLHAACGHAAPAITALQALRERLGPRAAEIREILIKGYKASAALTNPDPRSPAEAKFSLPVIAALVLAYGRVSLAELAPERIHDPRIREVAAKVRVVEDAAIAAEFPRLRAGEVVVTLASGETLAQRVDAPLGMPENPVAREVLEAKFRSAAEGLFNASRQEAILAAARNLLTGNPADLIALLRAPEGARP